MNKPGVRNSIWLGILALTFIWPPECAVEAVQFSYNGFSPLSDLLLGGHWNFTASSSSIYLTPSNKGTAVAGRFLHPQPVRMKNPQTTSFSCSFIFQILVQNGSDGRTGSGLTFMMVPDNSTVGALGGYMGLLSTNSIENAHTFGVEFDTHKNPEFNDPDGNHIGVNLASMNSTATFNPHNTPLAYHIPSFYFQVWIEYYSQTLDIYFGEYGQGKPTKPFSTTVNLSLLNEYMFIGFSAAVEQGVDNLHTFRMELQHRRPCSKDIDCSK